jgi:lysophospholipase L1-like esterase
MKSSSVLALAALLLAGLLQGAWCAETGKKNFWEGAIVAFEKADAVAPPPEDAILFIGSSTMVLWTTTTLQRQFPEHQIINRGFGGSQVSDAVEYAPRIVIPYAPRAVYFRSGGNDLWVGKSPDQVCADFQKFVAAVHAKLPETDIIFVSFSPCIARLKQVEITKEYNQKVAAFIQGKPHLRYIETSDIVFGPDGKIRPDLFLKDLLHFNDKGYELLGARIKPDLVGHYSPDRKPGKK